MVRSSLAAKAVAACCAAVFVLVACSNDGPSEPQAAPTPTPTPDPTCPLTGEPPPSRVDLARHAVAVKIENSPQARPQHGLEDADLVFEEIVEGGITRFMAIYHCGDSDDAGPVRSARFDDPRIALPFTRVIAYSGSNGFVDRQLKKRNMIRLNEINQRTAFFRVPPGTLLVHNLYVETDGLRRDRRVRRVDPPASDLFSFGPLQEGARRASFIGLHFNKDIEISYEWRRGAWRRFESGPFLTNDGEQIAVPNVLVHQVEVNNSRRLVDSAGNPSPTIDLKNGGKAWLFRDGRVITGTWKSKDGRFVYETKDGDPFVFATGQIWVELLPSKKGEVKGSLRFR